ncbi:MAG TPA: MmcQ/YjbR family DNA-binding protein [Thermoanaerobaculia bacterium]
MSIRVAEVRQLLLDLPDVVEGRSYGMPSFLVHGHFLARFRDDDTVLALRIASIDDRDVLMQVHPRAFFFTDHYRDYPAVLIRLAEVPKPLLHDVLKAAWKHVSSQKPKRKSR